MLSVAELGFFKGSINKQTSDYFYSKNFIRGKACLHFRKTISSDGKRTLLKQMTFRLLSLPWPIVIRLLSILRVRLLKKHNPDAKLALKHAEILAPLLLLFSSPFTSSFFPPFFLFFLFLFFFLSSSLPSSLIKKIYQKSSKGNPPDCPPPLVPALFVININLRTFYIY